MTVVPLTVWSAEKSLGSKIIFGKTCENIEMTDPSNIRHIIIEWMTYTIYYTNKSSEAILELQNILQ